MTIKGLWARYKAWCKDPFRYHETVQQHHCRNCGNDFTSNYCPTCGQKAGIGPITWNTLWLECLNVWGMGNRSLLFSLWQLLWRPGYFIDDYINGRRLVSFPPVKMLFIVCLFCYLAAKYLLPPDAAETLLFIPANQNNDILEPLIAFTNWLKDHRDWGSLVIATALLPSTWIIFREAPRNTHHTLPQSFFIQVFVCMQMMIFHLIGSVLPFFAFVSNIWIVVMCKQLFGYGWWGTIWRTALVAVCTFLLAIGLVGIADIVNGIIHGTDPQYQQNIGLIGLSILMLTYMFLPCSYINLRSWKRYRWWGTIWRILLVIVLSLIFLFVLAMTMDIVEKGWDEAWSRFSEN